MEATQSDYEDGGFHQPDRSRHIFSELECDRQKWSQFSTWTRGKDMLTALYARARAVVGL